MGIRLYRDFEPDALWVCGVNCKHITGPFSWEESDVSIQLEPSIEPFHGYAPGSILDKRAGFERRCGTAILVHASLGERPFDRFNSSEPGEGWGIW